MADESLSANSIRDRSFGTERRGYDRAEVDRFKVDVADTVGDLSARLAQLDERLAQLGLEDLDDLKVEFDAVGSEVSRVLQSAREAAENLRSRAAADAGRWRAEADEAARYTRSESAQGAESLRGQAWDAATAMLAEAKEQTESILATANQDALFIRAEAEREALRLTGDARRDAEEQVRGARLESDRMLMEARAESQGILDSARQSAEAAQERARALEQRRSELMEELESARTSIGQLEQEIDTRREALQIASDGATVTDAPREGDASWLDEDASVRIVPANRFVAVEPVDADAMAAEVEQLRAPEQELADDDEPEAKPEDTADAAEPKPEDEPSPEEPVVESDDAAIVSGDDAEDGIIDEALDEHAPASSELDDLFAKLRHEPEPEVDAEPVAEPPTEDAASSGEVTIDATEVADEAAVDAPVPPTAEPVLLEVDPFELRDRLLLPIANRALRGVKRQIVDLQNRVLEEVRVAKADWSPDAAMFGASLADDISQLMRESYVAGYAGAAELVGAATPQPDRPSPTDATPEFVAGLTQAVADALKAAANGGGGARQVSAAVSKVFRAWRTDEAERRLRRAAVLAYHEGLVAAFPSVGVSSVVAVCPGTVCEDGCPAAGGRSWDPAGPLPPGASLPPVGEHCTSTIVPSAS